METLRALSTGVAMVAVGLMAGLFYAFSCAVMRGLRRLDDRTFVEVMQRINAAILNGWFLTVYVGALLLTGLTVALHVPAAGRADLPWLAAAFVLYLATVVITAAVNVPLNQRLDAADDPTAARSWFEATWNRWNLARTLTSTGSFVALVVAAV